MSRYAKTLISPAILIYERQNVMRCHMFIPKSVHILGPCSREYVCGTVIIIIVF